jgi:hypothetical protein
MTKRNQFTSWLPILITYVLVKEMQNLAGFEYDLFKEGVLTFRFVLDIASWVVVYVLVSFLLQKVFSTQEAKV